MKLKAIKKGILALPDKEIKPLVEWLGNYYDGPVWNRQMDADIERLGADEWERRLTDGMDLTIPASPLAVAAHREEVRRAQERMEQARRRRLAALRLLNRMHFPTKAARTRMLKDFECVLGESLGTAVERPTPKQS